MNQIDSILGTREKILKAAVELFGDKGYHATSVQSICDLAGVTKGAFFHYFPNKNQILFEIHEFIIDRWNAECEKVLGNDDLDPSEKIYEITDVIIGQLIDYRQHGKILFRELNNIEGEMGEIVKAKRGHSEEIVATVIEAGMKKGDFKPNQNSLLLAKLYFGMCNWTLHWYRPEGDLTTQQMATIIGNAFIGGLMGVPR